MLDKVNCLIYSKKKTITIIIYRRLKRTTTNGHNIALEVLINIDTKNIYYVFRQVYFLFVHDEQLFNKTQYIFCSV
jgi:hypothetical protein